MRQTFGLKAGNVAVVGRVEMLEGLKLLLWHFITIVQKVGKVAVVGRIEEMNTKYSFFPWTSTCSSTDIYVKKRKPLQLLFLYVFFQYPGLSLWPLGYFYLPAC